VGIDLCRMQDDVAFKYMQSFSKSLGGIDEPPAADPPTWSSSRRSWSRPRWMTPASRSDTACCRALQRDVSTDEVRPLLKEVEA